MATKFRYLKWHITKKRATKSNDNTVQLSEFQLLDAKGDVYPWPSNTSVTSNPVGLSGETAEKIIDGQTSTKLCVAWTTNSSQTGSLEIVIDVGSGNEINLSKYNRYCYYTSNDEESRDPISWTLYGSNDASAWEVLDTQSDLSNIPTTRYTQAGIWEMDVEPENRVFQPGIVGKTNVVEGAVIPIKPKTQYLFNYGDTCDEITGGWGLKQNWSNYPNGTGGVVDNYLYSADEGSNYGNGQMATKNMIDMRGYSKLYAIISCVATKSGSYNCSCSVVISKEDYNYNSSWGTTSASVYTTLADAGWNTSSGATSVENLLVEIDISEIDEGLVWFKTWSGSLNSHTAKGKCYAIWMEP